jgi:DNA-directed RNA polymerase delta subunit
MHNLCPGRWRERVIRDPKEIRDHVESYYKSLFGKEQVGSITLGDNFWNERERLSNEEAEELISLLF